jgi:hypothetical protein
MYYNSGDSLGVLGIPIDNIKHEKNGYTYINGRNFSWIKSSDLFISREDAENSQKAKIIV